MCKKSFQQFLSLLALLGMVRATNSPIAQCAAQAWVRAPDLTPDTVIQGDARVKISAECPAVESVTLGLRLKERSFLKALRSQEDRDWMSAALFPFVDPPQAPAWIPTTSNSSNPCDEITLHEMLINKDLWVVREEEQIVFETTQTIHLAGGASGDRDVVQEFAVLVPPTNFPPGVDYMDSEFFPMDPGDFEMDNVELMYEYFVRIPFANGTTKHISAGFTSFHPLQDPAGAFRGPSSGTTILKLEHVVRKYSPITNYTVQVTSSVFIQGSENQAVTVVVTRTGPARTFTKPLTIRGSIHPILSSKWVTEYDIPNSQPMHGPQHILRSTLEDCQAKYLWLHPNLDYERSSVAMPNSTADELESQEIVTTTSAPVTLPINVDRRHITNFETYYQTLSNSLSITLETPRTQNGIVDPDQPFYQAERFPLHGRMFTDDEEPWVPWEKTVFEMLHPVSWHTYSGSIPVIVQPMGEVAPSCLSQFEMGMPDQVFLFGEAGCEKRPINHYLDEGSRGPTFVDSSAVHELLAEGSAERERLAPILQPVVSSPPDGEELVYRYYESHPLIYVGGTWVKKVTSRASSLH